MKQRVFTLMWGNAWERYGQRFYKGFREHWPGNVELMIVTDRDLPAPWATQVQLKTIDGYKQFMDKWGGHNLARGYHSPDRKAQDNKRFWKHDAVKWAPQGLCGLAGLGGMGDGDLLTWLDADVMTIADVPAGWANVLLDGHDVACLQRENQHSEIGFWCARIGAGTQEAIRAFNQIYTDGSVFNLREWHSAFVFDAALASVPALRIRNLVPPGARGNVWARTPLKQYTWHLKGKLKDQ